MSLPITSFTNTQDFKDFSTPKAFRTAPQNRIQHIEELGRLYPPNFIDKAPQEIRLLILGGCLSYRDVSGIRAIACTNTLNYKCVDLFVKRQVKLTKEVVFDYAVAFKYIHKYGFDIVNPLSKINKLAMIKCAMECIEEERQNSREYLLKQGPKVIILVPQKLVFRQEPLKGVCILEIPHGITPARLVKFKAAFDNADT